MKRVATTAMKFEAALLHFLGDVFASVAVVFAYALY